MGSAVHFVTLRERVRVREALRSKALRSKALRSKALRSNISLEAVLLGLLAVYTKLNRLEGKNLNFPYSQIRYSPFPKPSPTAHNSS